MPEHTEATPTEQQQPNDYRHARMSDWRKSPWPINEVLLETLVLSGRKDSDIAAIWSVGAEDVRDLRERYGL